MKIYAKNILTSALYGTISYIIAIITGAISLYFVELSTEDLLNDSSEHENIYNISMLKGFLMITIGPIFETLVVFLPLFFVFRKLLSFSERAMLMASFAIPLVIGFLVHGGQIYSIAPASGFAVLGIYSGIMMKNDFRKITAFFLISFSHAVWNSLSLGISWIRSLV